ncbi:hypothetical protein LCGC14_0478430 [marine sediment metagenome]|uniref:Uncharacterized protein n=1 Tax=marine sediment metagenome TaxID=412755 RepID=A0A0F9SF97_9ZZZZ
MWFKRDWQLIDKTILPSGFEQLKGGSFKNATIKFFQKTLVLTFKCSLTGKVKTTVVRS